MEISTSKEIDVIYENVYNLIENRGHIILTPKQTNINNIRNESVIKIDTNKSLFIIINNNVNTKTSNKKYDTDIMIINTLKNNKKELTVIMKNKINSNQIKKINKIRFKFSLEIILYKPLLNNFVITNANIMNRYTKLNNKTIESILEFYKIPISKMMYMSYDDIVSIWYDFRPEDVVELNGISPLNNITSTYYKLITNIPLSEFRFLYKNDNNVNEDMDIVIKSSATTDQEQSDDDKTRITKTSNDEVEVLNYNSEENDSNDSDKENDYDDSDKEVTETLS